MRPKQNQEPISTCPADLREHMATEAKGQGAVWRKEKIVVLAIRDKPNRKFRTYHPKPGIAACSGTSASQNGA